MVVAAACCLRWENNLCSLYADDQVETEKFSSNVREEVRQNGIKCMHTLIHRNRKEAQINVDR